jgi:hypothetical protein
MRRNKAGGQGVGAPGTIFSPTTELTRVPCEKLGLPVSRRQVRILAGWLEDMCSQVESACGDAHDTVDKLLTIHRFAVLELLRQVSVQCVERGELLQRSIESYIYLTKK